MVCVKIPQKCQTNSFEPPWTLIRSWMGRFDQNVKAFGPALTSPANGVLNLLIFLMAPDFRQLNNLWKRKEISRSGTLSHESKIDSANDNWINYSAPFPLFRGKEKLIPARFLLGIYLNSPTYPLRSYPLRTVYSQTTSWRPLRTGGNIFKLLLQ